MAEDSRDLGGHRASRASRELAPLEIWNKIFEINIDSTDDMAHLWIQGRRVNKFWREKIEKVVERKWVKDFTLAFKIPFPLFTCRPETSHSSHAYTAYLRFLHFTPFTTTTQYGSPPSDSTAAVFKLEDPNRTPFELEVAMKDIIDSMQPPRCYMRPNYYVRLWDSIFDTEIPLLRHNDEKGVLVVHWKELCNSFFTEQFASQAKIKRWAQDRPPDSPQALTDIKVKAINDVRRARVRAQLSRHGDQEMVYWWLRDSEDAAMRDLWHLRRQARRDVAP